MRDHYRAGLLQSRDSRPGRSDSARKVDAVGECLVLVIRGGSIALGHFALSLLPREFAGQTLTVLTG